MAVDMFLKLGDIKGESKDSVHKETIDVLAWSWGASNSGSAQIGGGAGVGKVNVQDLSFTKFVDKASPDIFLATCNATVPPPSRRNRTLANPASSIMRPSESASGNAAAEAGR